MGGLPVDVRTRTTEDLLVSDITRDVADAVRESGIRDGICCVYSPAPSCAVRVNEFESGIVDDFTALVTRLLAELARDGDDAAGSSRESVRDTRTRCLSMLFGPAGEAIPVANGELCLGTWQRVLFIEFERGSGDDRGWLTQVVGRPEGQTRDGA